MIKLKNREEKGTSKEKQKLYQPDFKAKIALEALREEKKLAQISGEHDMHVNNVMRE